MADDKTALVTGGSRGIGRAIAKLLVKNDYSVIAVYKKSEVLSQALKIKYKKLLTFKADIGSEDDLKNVVDFTKKHFNHLDVLVNNAAIDIPGFMKDYKSNDWDTMMRVNLKSVFLLSQHCLPLLQKANDGVIINISSRLGIPDRAHPKFFMYGITKAGVNILTTCLAKELENTGIRVNAIMPTATKTDLLDKVMRKELQDQYAKEGKLGKPEEVAELVMELVNDTSASGKLLLDPRIA
ncbi:SDR family oxidoreductase [Patescibacteria group bacterium]